VPLHFGASKKEQLYLTGLCARLLAARRFAVRFLAAAIEAFLARADRSLGVMFFAAVFPPSLP